MASIAKNRRQTSFALNYQLTHQLLGRGPVHNRAIVRWMQFLIAQGCEWKLTLSDSLSENVNRFMQGNIFDDFYGILRLVATRMDVVSRRLVFGIIFVISTAAAGRIIKILNTIQDLTSLENPDDGNSLSFVYSLNRNRSSNTSFFSIFADNRSIIEAWISGMQWTWDVADSIIERLEKDSDFSSYDPSRCLLASPHPKTQPCQEKLPFVCQTRSSGSECGAEYLQINDVCYRIHWTKLNHHDAAKQCNKFNETLAFGCDTHLEDVLGKINVTEPVWVAGQWRPLCWRENGTRECVSSPLCGVSDQHYLLFDGLKLHRGNTSATEYPYICQKKSNSGEILHRYQFSSWMQLNVSEPKAIRLNERKARTTWARKTRHPSEKPPTFHCLGSSKKWVNVKDLDAFQWRYAFLRKRYKTDRKVKTTLR
ncbi:hypothetical protein CAPTEDRAFT_206310 [Capitella teleta]|uniref:C-type lectin domain-containing protein n=1 Tax=Capitella teleta TaxID=283909 RepID=R7TF92_CAPTE|nr:hypothetical protein CAPTEDRAFT_206310 [Capitella teleta]|eukprot:ELT92404.1 hypothetical protein CAPTEDRAFT_206310 [Capitella teleta]